MAILRQVLMKETRPETADYICEHLYLGPAKKCQQVYHQVKVFASKFSKGQLSV